MQLFVESACCLLLWCPPSCSSTFAAWTQSGAGSDEAGSEGRSPVEASPAVAGKMMLAAKQGNRLQRETGRYQACACACRPHRRGAPQQATCAKGVDARQGRWRGQAGGLRQNTTSGGGVRGDRGQVEPCAHRSTDERRCRRGRWRRPRGRRCRREPPPGGGGRARAREAPPGRQLTSAFAPAKRPARSEPGWRGGGRPAPSARAPAARATLPRRPRQPPRHERAPAGRGT